MAEKIDEYLNGRYETVLQSERLGTGHAVMQAVPFMEKKRGRGNTLVLCGDAPFIDSETIKKVPWASWKGEDNSIAVITAEIDGTKGLWQNRRGESSINSIVEKKDATAAQREIKSKFRSLLVLKPPTY